MTMPNLVTGNQPKTVVIHMGAKNNKLRGYFSISMDHQTGKKYLIGEEIVGTYRCEGEVVEVKKKIRIDITGYSITNRG